MTSFREALDRHLEAIQARDVDALAATVDPDEVVLVTAAGEVSFDTERFLGLHREWFAMEHWRLDAEVIHLRETAELATCLIRLDYREDRPEAPYRDESVLSLVFRRRGDAWVMVQDQNTPIHD